MKREKIICLFIAILFLQGCASGPYKAIRTSRKADLYEDTESIVMLDGEIRRELQVVSERVSRTEDDRLTVSIDFINKKKTPLKARVQTLFKDAEGNITDKTNWEHIIIAEKAQYYYKSTSLNPKAQDYVVRCKHETIKRKGSYDD